MIPISNIEFLSNFLIGDCDLTAVYKNNAIGIMQCRFAFKEILASNFSSWREFEYEMVSKHLEFRLILKAKQAALGNAFACGSLQCPDIAVHVGTDSLREYTLTLTLVYDGG